MVSIGADIANQSMAAGPDIILGVARAADAVKHREAVSRLERMSGQTMSAADAGAPSGEIASEWTADVRHAGPTTPTRSASFRAQASPTDGSDKMSDVHVQFEALLLQNMVEAMMPKDSDALMGSGTAGNIWKSMLAEKIAEQIARSGEIGIAKQIASGPAVASAGAPSAQSKVE